MQNIFYDEAPYHILYYDAELHAYRTDKFGGWVNQPTESGMPLFGYGPSGTPADRDHGPAVGRASARPPRRRAARRRSRGTPAPGAGRSDVGVDR